MTDVLSPTSSARLPARLSAPGAPALPRADRFLPIAARRDPFVATVARQLLRRCGLRGGERVVVGVSGGADSIALLIAAAVLRDRGSRRTRVTPIAVHVHHHLRGASADEDAAFTESVAGHLGVPLVVEHIDPAARGGNVAASARDLRYHAIRDAAIAAQASHVAVGHHADDQLETMLIALGRGSGLGGLAGMAWSRPLGSGVSLVRPLLGVRRSACEAFCRVAGTGWRNDPSNADPDKLRARLRRDVLPVIEALWPGAAARATGTADAVATAQHAVGDVLDRSFGPAQTRRWSRAALAALPPALIAAGLRRAALDADAALTDALNQRNVMLAAEAVADDTTRPRRFTWPAGLRLHVTAREVILMRDEPME